jgi:hypothetical protein
MRSRRALGRSTAGPRLFAALLALALVSASYARAQEPELEPAGRSASEREVQLANWAERRRLRAERHRDPEHFERAREDLRREQWQRIRDAIPPRVVVMPSTRSRAVVYVPDDVRSELRAHARRMAALERIREVAARRAELMPRVDALIRREVRRHSTRMASFGIQVVP